MALNVEIVTLGLATYPRVKTTMLPIVGSAVPDAKTGPDAVI
jgi:hypothetical protein